MREMWIIARHEYLVNVRRTGFIITTALVPLLGVLGLLVAAFFGGKASAFLERQFAPELKEIGVVDQLGAFTPILPAYRERYHLFADEDAGRAATQADEVTAVLIIPEDYVETGWVMVLSKGSGFSAAVMEDSATVRQFFVDHLLGEEVSPALRKRLADPMEPVLVSLEPEGDTRGGPMSTALNIMVPYFIGILLVMTVFTRKSRAASSRSSSPLSRPGSFWQERSWGSGPWDSLR
jgi:ABC-type Na+ efflux pump permease subunit